MENNFKFEERARFVQTGMQVRTRLKAVEGVECQI